LRKIERSRTWVTKQSKDIGNSILRPKHVAV
jgi:hypothetical protein